jgi:hypothetical protein
VKASGSDFPPGKNATLPGSVTWAFCFLPSVLSLIHFPTSSPCCVEQIDKSKTFPIDATLRSKKKKI